MSWLLGLLAAFAFLGTRRRSSRIDVHVVALALVLIVVGLQTLMYQLS